MLEISNVFFFLFYTKKNIDIKNTQITISLLPDSLAFPNLNFPSYLASITRFDLIIRNRERANWLAALVVFSGSSRV